MIILRQDCCPCTNESLSPCGKMMVVTYDWTMNSSRDLDTHTAGFGESAGWSCSPSGIYLNWVTGDCTAANCKEIVQIDINKAKTDGLWTSSFVIQCYAGWYEPAEGSGAFTLRVDYCGQAQKTKVATPGSQSSCASTFITTITGYDDGTFTLS